MDASAPVLGAVTTLFFSIENYFLVLMLSFLAGSFLYMGGGSLLPDAYKMNRAIITTVFFSLGLLAVLLFAIIL